jgi:aminoethylphosphonate catabolism LysR family transcriptional regulator
MSHSQLRAFHAVAIAGSFTAAARQLHVTQPAVTMQVKALEEEHGAELFRRRGRKIERTDLGDALFARTTRLFGLEEEIEEMLRAARGLGGGRLRAGADAPYHVISLLAAFRAKHPDVTVSLSVGNAAEVLSALSEGRTDVAVVAEVPPDVRFHSVPCVRHRVVAIVARSHPWVRRRRIALTDLADQPMILREPESVTRRTFEAALAKVGVVPRVAMEIGSREAVREAVAAGLGIGVVASAELGEDARLAALAIEGAALDNTEYAVCLGSRRDLRLVKAFFELLPKSIADRSAPRRGRGRQRAG